MTSPVRWRKSSRSGSQSNCVEVAHTLDLVRDSKNPDGPVLKMGPGFLAAVKAGRFDA
jgi:hypothetical protein